MKGKVMFAAGVAVGYIWGSKSWPEVYRRIRGGSEKVLKNPEVQENVHHAAETVQESVPEIVDNLYAAGKKLLEKAEALFPGILDSKGGETTRPEDRPVTTPTVKGDVVSDPALDDTTGSDWTDEGGAAPEGPATNTRPKP
ncbi:MULTISPECIES: hypothetical protein [Paenarthrobacter]|uniref:hypothetical protein n=1 Tax=Paenarthrobacter TaxID=1742992 RepID=UPI001877E08E|nr:MULTISPECIES: hypothetical protein [Paenarthrobacter]MCW3767462.1 hypothetical protein [Paenarthrobacter sp. PAE-2]QOT15422.1 hypothetical protein HMI59_01700 [Paenarthrobacter sp. YJN-5]QQQ62105.1 hypothetical protein JHQ56_17990 [Paenarthrobacter ureafaciens]UOD81077.1 hypothetical protein MQZ73_18540 [Paenarthrobacter ureafaciens]WNZ03736.1 hypothetical protein PVT25_19195 [Paenarthrobacter ureafaciens]